MSEAQSSTTEYCADVIATYQGKFVVVERLSEPKGFAWPGGRRNAGESSIDCAVREFKEETGLVLRMQGFLGTYDKPDRDPRGPKISDVYFGLAKGIIAYEKERTIVHLLSREKIIQSKHQFVFDHYQMFEHYQQERA